jgi:DNA-binding transcriptional regulator GbsR (MarR family)
MPTSGQAELAAIFADMAPRLGLSRPAGQCFAIIWRAAQAPSADDLMAGLGLSRSNISNALKELREWGLVQVLRSPGNRREFFSAPADPWALARLIIAERQRRDIAPALDRLYQIEATAPDARVAALCEMLEAVSTWTNALARREPRDLAAHISAAEHPADPKKKKKKKD